MSADFETRIALGNELEKAGKDDEAIAHFRLMLDEYPDDPRILYEYGGAFDTAGRENEAIPLYRKALEKGLSGMYVPQLYLQLASTLRNVGQLDEAITILQDACRQFPERPSLKLFLALALESADRDHDALTALFDLAVAHVDTADMKRYARSIRAYVDDRR
ncbi:MAG: tetratricopeptide repeat protein [Chloroflexota bacterium]|nr:tetratricopeptide repeat protein [Anaerolineae bacterium]